MESQETPVKKRVSPFCKPSNRYVARKKLKERLKSSHTIDLKKVVSWAQVGCTLEEISSLLGVSVEWLKSEKEKDYALEDALQTGIVNFKQSLRSTQARLALSGHPGMLIWLGKQYLGQSDKSEQKQEIAVNVTLQKAVEELRALDTDTIMEMKRLLEAPKTPLIDSEAPDAIVMES